MIYLKIRGRLGNQLFQYNAVKALKEKYYKNEKIFIDFSDLKKLGSEEDGFCNSLKDFKIYDYEPTENIKINFLQKIIVFIMKIPNPFLRLIGLSKYADFITYKFEYFIQPLINFFGVYYMIHGYRDMKKAIFKNKIVYGNFESSQYFDEYIDEIRKTIVPKTKQLKRNKQLYEIINNTESICITIRRGDFVENQEFKKIHYVCDDNFFYKGVNLIKNKIKKPVFIVFSDDVEWVKNNMDFGLNEVYYETGNDPVWEKLRLMSKCKHFIISNSTFSWWAQYLSSNNKKIVIAPKRWKNITYKNNNKQIDIYQDNWIKI